MKLYFRSEPFDHIIIENLYDEKEYKIIIDEMEWIVKSNILSDSNNTQNSKSAFTELYDLEKGKYEKIILSTKKCLFLDNLYAMPELSKILTINSKLLEETYNFLYRNDEIKNKSFLFHHYFKNITKYTTLLNFYQNAGEYKSHFDRSIFTCVWFHWKNKKLFEGGNLFFEEYDYSFECTNNSAIIFPSPLLHSVLPIKSKTDFSVLDGRYSITNFLLIPQE